MQKCPICFELIEEGMCSLPCGHFYHDNCITRWIKECEQNQVQVCCPLCLCVASRSSVRKHASELPDGTASSKYTPKLDAAIDEEARRLLSILHPHSPNGLAESGAATAVSEEDRNRLSASTNPLRTFEFNKPLQDPLLLHNFLQRLSDSATTAHYRSMLTEVKYAQALLQLDERDRRLWRYREALPAGSSKDNGALPKVSAQSFLATVNIVVPPTSVLTNATLLFKPQEPGTLIAAGHKRLHFLNVPTTLLSNTTVGPVPAVCPDGLEEPSSPADSLIDSFLPISEPTCIAPVHTPYSYALSEHAYAHELRRAALYGVGSIQGSLYLIRSQKIVASLRPSYTLDVSHKRVNSPIVGVAERSYASAVLMACSLFLLDCHRQSLFEHKPSRVVNLPADGSRASKDSALPLSELYSALTTHSQFDSLVLLGTTSGRIVATDLRMRTVSGVTFLGTLDSAGGGREADLAVHTLRAVGNTVLASSTSQSFLYDIRQPQQPLSAASIFSGSTITDSIITSQYTVLTSRNGFVVYDTSLKRPYAIVDLSMRCSCFDQASQRIIYRANKSTDLHSISYDLFHTLPLSSEPASC